MEETKHGNAFKDITGQKFGKLTVISISEKQKEGREKYWDCICECGNKIAVSGYKLRSGKTTSCGCENKGPKEDLTGKKFNRLTVTGLNKKRGKHGEYYWNCKCDCGKETVVKTGDLKSGNTKSCGCAKDFIKDMTGMRFGKLVVTGLNEKRGHAGEAQWDCVCDCGNKITVNGVLLRNGEKTSCGCVNTKITDIKGQRFGMLTVTSLDEELSKEKKKGFWNCKCDCGNKIVVDGSRLRRGEKTSCGCQELIEAKQNEIKKISYPRTKEKTEEKMATSIKGLKFGMLTVLNLDHYEGERNVPFWKCKCDCGNETIVSTPTLKKSKKICNCGCLDKLYHRFKGMKSRCYNQKNQHYDRYGGRGITICQEWLDDPNAFVRWALANGYKDELQIDRIDNDKGYSPENCRWVTSKENSRNTSSNVNITVNGETKTASEWAEIHNMNPDTITARIRAGKSDENAVNDPIANNNNSYGKILKIKADTLEILDTYDSVIEAAGGSESIRSVLYRKIRSMEIYKNTLYYIEEDKIEEFAEKIGAIYENGKLRF